MKECPNCKKHFTDDLFFCLYDGVPLTEHGEGEVDRYAPTVAAIDLGQSAGTPADRTEVLPNLGNSDPTQSVPAIEQPTPPYIEQPAPRSSSKWPYVIIGFLALAFVGLAAAMIVINRDRIFPASNSSVKVDNETKTTPTPVPTPTVLVTVTGQPANTVKGSKLTGR